MKKAYFFIVVILIISFLGCQPKVEDLLIDSFEGQINSKTVDFGSSEDTALNVEASTEFKICGEQSIKVDYNLAPKGYMWVARGYNLDVKGAGNWQIAPQNIDWEKYNALSIYVYGRNSGGVIAFDIKDGGGEIWRFLLDDDFVSWKEIVCLFDEFSPRTDWQPQTAQLNEVLDFPIMSFQFEPRVPGKGIYYFDCVKLINTKSR